MSSTAVLHSKWRAHGAFRQASNCLGLLPRTGIHIMLTTASPATVAAVIADMAVAVASNLVDCPLVSKPGANRKSSAGFAGSHAHVAPMAVAILSASPAMDLNSAVHAAVLARGIVRPLEIAWTRLETGSLATAQDAGRRLHDLADSFQTEIGLVVVVDDFVGDRVGDAPLWRNLIAIASVIHAPLLVVTTRAPAELDADAVVMRLDDKMLAIDNPIEGGPFAVSLEKEGVDVGAETVPVVKFGPRRAWSPPMRVEPEKQQPESPVALAERKKPLTIERIYLVQTGRQLGQDETSFFGDCRWTDDFMHAIKLSCQSIEDRAEIIVVPSDRDPRREAASATAQRVRSQILSAGLDGKVSVSVAPALVIAA